MLKAIIMAGGKGTRLKSQLPKVLHPLMEKPLLRFVLDALAQMTEKPDEVFVITGHEAEQVNTCLSSWQADLPFAIRPVHQSPQLGTGHAVQQVLGVLPADTDCRVLVLSGDVPLIRPLSLDQLAAQQDDVTLTAAALGDPTGYGRVVGRQQNGQQSGYQIIEEKDCPAELKSINLVNAGIYQAKWTVLATLLQQLTNNNAQSEYYLTDCVRLASEQGHQVGVVALKDASEMMGVNSRADLTECHQILNRRVLSHWMTEGVTIIDPASTWIGPDVQLAADVTVYPHCWLTGKVTVGAGSHIGPGATLTGTQAAPVTVGQFARVQHSTLNASQIGDHTTVGPYAHIRHNSVVGDHVRVGNFVEIKQSHMGNNSNAAHLAYLGDATLGQHVNVGAGTITANYDPIRNVKSPTIIEDEVKLGSNCVLVAPVTIHQKACVAAGSVITQDVAAGSLAIARERQRVIDDWVTKSVTKTTSHPLPHEAEAPVS
jgi:bifunctional UDP-N-acetylglucosamine pyrophosphorylase / glucosamine-1-phosphate N-acetyltransferase